MRYALNIGAGGDGRDPIAMAESAVLAEDSGWDAMLLEDYVVYGTAYGGPAPPTARPVQRPRIPIWVGGDFRVPGVRRRVSRWDGSVACVACGDDGERPLDPREIDTLLGLVREQQGNADGFDVCVGTGLRPDDWEAEREHVRTVAAAGATWWYEWIPPADPDTTRKSISRGPLRID